MKIGETYVTKLKKALNYEEKRIWDGISRVFQIIESLLSKLQTFEFPIRPIKFISLDQILFRNAKNFEKF